MNKLEQYGTDVQKYGLNCKIREGKEHKSRFAFITGSIAAIVAFLGEKIEDMTKVVAVAIKDTAETAMIVIKETGKVILPTEEMFLDFGTGFAWPVQITGLTSKLSGTAILGNYRDNSAVRQAVAQIESVMFDRQGRLKGAPSRTYATFVAPESVMNGIRALLAWDGANTFRASTLNRSGKQIRNAVSGTRLLSVDRKTGQAYALALSQINLELVDGGLQFVKAGSFEGPVNDVGTVEQYDGSQLIVATMERGSKYRYLPAWLTGGETSVASSLQLDHGNAQPWSGKVDDGAFVGFVDPETAAYVRSGHLHIGEPDQALRTLIAKASAAQTAQHAAGAQA